MAPDTNLSTPSRVITFKLRPEERARLREAAGALGIGPCSYAADAVRHALGTERRRPLPPPRSDLTDAVREATGALGRVGNNVNQIARRLNGGDGGQVTDLAAIRMLLAAIDARLATASEA